ncbi:MULTISPECIES: flavodoxin family protein [Anaerosinus]|uniref:Flavodoxin family protein n=1 Tax=Selenobaculum gibii TaxID=3054208 RepID=A0A9Y2EVJ6_9FIRM|nr:flavodoxin family protein [Selenobaculum gbiensis]WIW71284.1 flavodoxin family protein [Selenobaculum gbiensis]
MKVLLVNGSPHEKGCTYTALAEIATTLESEGIETQIFWLGIKPLSGCIACKTCAKIGKCVFNDKVNEFLAIANNFDGYIFGSPVHWAAASGAITSFMDRIFYAANCSGQKIFYLKPAAAIVSARRAGTTAAFDQLNKYFTLMQMPIIASQYWNMVHGAKPEDVKKDLEGLQTMRTLARNMAFYLRCKEAGLKAGVPLPTQEVGIYTNFIRD